MLVISNNLIGKTEIPKDAIIRVNLAWTDLNSAREILKNSKHDIYLDYPSGRTKPPKPTITLEEAMKLADEFNVKYFAISNCEDVLKIRELKEFLKCEIVPKIETVKGVENIDEIAKEVKMVMMDKDDLHINCQGVGYEKLVERVREADVKVLELVGVIFQ